MQNTRPGNPDMLQTNTDSDDSRPEQIPTSTGAGWGPASGQLSPLKWAVWGGAGSLYWSSPAKGTLSWELPALLWSRERVGARSLFSVNDAKTAGEGWAVNASFIVRKWEKSKAEQTARQRCVLSFYLIFFLFFTVELKPTGRNSDFYILKYAKWLISLVSK